MKNIIKRILALLHLKVTLVGKGYTFRQLGLNAGNLSKLPGGMLLLADFALKVKEDKHQFILKGVPIMYTLKNRRGAVFVLENEDLFLAKIEGITYHIQTWEELFILNEIFISGAYNYNTRNAFQVIDIGMNVGISSLFFARKEECMGVYSFEPFKVTFEQALNNLSLNPLIAGKIQPFNIGLGNRSYRLTVKYDKEIKGNMGINGIPDYLHDVSRSLSEEKISIEDAAEALGPIVKTIRDKGHDVLLKMDCEGSEYDIFESLNRTGLIRSFDAIVLEWHFKGPLSICDSLMANGYALFSFNHENQMSGMIYAFR